MTKFEMAKRNFISRYFWVLGAVTTGTVISLFGMSPLFFAPLAVGVLASGFSTTRFYKGDKSNKLRWLLSSIFLGKKSRKIIEEYREDLEKYNSLKGSFGLLNELVRHEVETDNLLEIVNKKPDENGRYIILLDDGIFVKITKEKYQKMFNISQNEIDVEEKSKIIEGLLKKKIEAFHARELTS